MPTVKRLTSCFAALFLAAALHCSAQEKVDLEMIGKIRYEGFHNSKIMEIASGLMDHIGPRLTGSPNMKRANEWTRDKLKDFGLVNSHLEPWEPFGRGWSNEYTNVRMVSPDIATLDCLFQSVDTRHRWRGPRQGDARKNCGTAGPGKISRQTGGQDPSCWRRS